MHSLIRVTILCALASAVPAASAGAQQAAALDTGFLRHVGVMARQRATQLAPPNAPAENPRVLTQYRDALSDLERGAFTDAATTMTAILQRVPQNALYRGELAYAYLRAGAFEQAGTEYTRAYQLQQRNGWFLLGIACTKAAQRQFADAAGAADLAADTDSSIIDATMASTSAGWFEAAGDRTRALFWARAAVQRSADDAVDWLRVASYLMSRSDTTQEGIRAIRRYLALRPGEKLGSAVYANYLFVTGQDDSALIMATAAAQDSAYRPFAAQMFLQAGRTLLRRRETDRALTILAQGQVWADSTQRAPYSLFIGRGQLLKVSAALNTYQDSHTCESAHAADSLTNAAEGNMRAGMSADSAQTAQLLESVIPQYKANAQAALRGCQAPGAHPTTTRPATARPPARPRRP